MPDDREFKEEEPQNDSESVGKGYCPYTPDRECKTGKGGWSDSEECQECGWRAW